MNPLGSFIPISDIQVAALQAVRSVWPWVSQHDLQYRSRLADVVWCRWVFVYLLVEEAKLGRRDVADTIGWNDSSSVAHAMNRLAFRIVHEPRCLLDLARATIAFRALLRTEETNFIANLRSLAVTKEAIPCFK